MLDIRFIREKPDFVKAELAKCGVDPAEVDQILETDARRRRLQHELDDLRAQRTREHPVQGRVGLTILRDLVDRFEHRDRVREQRVFLAQRTVRLERLDLGDDVELAAL